MNFCNTCGRRLCIREIMIEGTKNIYHVCLKRGCGTMTPVTNFRVRYKKYTKVSRPKRYLNRYKTKDVTLQTKATTCPKCKTHGKNKMERKFFNNSFFIKNICSVCYHDWK